MKFTNGQFHISQVERDRGVFRGWEKYLERSLEPRPSGWSHRRLCGRYIAPLWSRQRFQLCFPRSTQSHPETEEDRVLADPSSPASRLAAYQTDSELTSRDSRYDGCMKLKLCLEPLFDDSVPGLLPSLAEVVSFADGLNHLFGKLRSFVSLRDYISVLVRSGCETS